MFVCYALLSNDCTLHSLVFTFTRGNARHWGGEAGALINACIHLATYH